MARWGFISRGVTLGVRALVIDEAGRVLLVRHGYAPGWHLPGGAVERGEAAAAAVLRELAEETGVRAEAAGAPLGVFFNPAYGGRDQVVLYRIATFVRGARPAPNREIAEIGWFALDALPEATTGATRRRLAELDGRASTGRW